MLQTAYTSRTRRKCVKIRILGDDKLEISVVGVNCVQSTCFAELSNGHAQIWFFSLIGTQHFGKLFSPDGENVACDDYYFLVAFYSFNTGKYTTFTQVMFTLLFCLIPKEIRTTCLVDNLQLFSTLLFQTPTFWWSGFAVQQYLSIIILVLYLFMSIYKTFINIAYIAIFLACSFSQSEK